MTNPLTSDQRRAFLCAPDPARYYAASAIDEARQRIVRSIARNEGPALVVGATGMGKSLLLAVLAEQFEPRMSVVRLPGAQLCTRRALLQMILSELRLPYRHMDEGELRLSILEHLRGPASSNPKLQDPSSHGREQPSTADPKSAERRAVATQPRPRRVLVLVDEADALPTRLLEELRVLTNHVSHGIPLVSVVLAGGSNLEERFADPELEKFSQRLSCRCYLAPLTRDETFQYVRSQVSAVGVKPEAWFDPDALAAIHSATGGAPRLVNQLCDQLVWLIEETGCQPLDAALVQQAWSDLQQLPAPWNTDAHSSLPSSPLASVGDHSANVIEFGELDDAHDAPQATIDRYDAASELFVGNEYQPSADARDLDDDMPASIPFDSARTRRSADLGVYSDAIDATERLVEELDEFETLELVGAEPESPAAPEPSPPRAAEDPFAEPFDEEEVLVDPYSTFESQMLRGARQVLNRIDRTFAAELARCEARKSKPLEELASRDVPVPGASELPSLPRKEQGEGSPKTISASNPTPTAPAPVYQAFTTLAPNSVTIEPQPVAVAPPTAQPAAVLVIEDDNAPAPSVVRSRQFRRLFTALESAVSRTHHG